MAPGRGTKPRGPYPRQPRRRGQTGRQWLQNMRLGPEAELPQSCRLGPRLLPHWPISNERSKWDRVQGPLAQASRRHCNQNPCNISALRQMSSLWNVVVENPV